jgi:hypothetical protein
MAAVPAGACVGEHIGTRVGQAQRVIQLAIGQQPGIGGDRGTAKLQHQRPIEIELQRTPTRFTRRVRHRRPAWFPTSYCILTHNRRECAQNARIIEGMREYTTGSGEQAIEVVA